MASADKPLIFKSESELPTGSKRISFRKEALRELFFIEYPELHEKIPGIEEKISEYNAQSPVSFVWVFYTDINTAVEIPEENMYFKLRTARNRNLITADEQFSYRDATIGIAGLSVGSAALAMLVATGGPKRLKIADPDTIEITNLNRIRAHVIDLGKNKTLVAARDAWRLDPFLEIETWENGVAPNTLERFVGAPRLDALVDEMDDIGLKIRVRNACSKARVPVVMATDNGDSVIVDVERFDEEPERPIFHGRVHISEEELQNIDRTMFIKLANEVIDVSYFTPRQYESILQIGKTLSGVPQLGSAASIAGAAVAYAVRQITTKAPLPSGRYVFGCDDGFKKNWL